MATPKKTSTPARKKPRAQVRSGNPASREIQERGPVRASDWIAGARPFTLSMSVAPVLIGTGAAIATSEAGELHWVRALLCLVVAIALQIGVNFANDYSDGIRGTDANRVGPARLVGGGRVRPKTVLIVALVFFGIAAIAGLALVVLSAQWWLLAVGALAIAAAWYYTGGKKPYGYMGLGELFVFIFFGLVATLGTAYVQVGTFPQEAWIGGVGVGFIAVATLIVNNLRDIDQDRLAGKRTLSTMIGKRASQWAYSLLMIFAIVLGLWLALFYSGAYLVLITLLVVFPVILIVFTAKTAKELILVLKLTGIAQLIYGITLFFGLAA